MRFVLAVILAVHGRIDLLGPSKAFGGTDVTQLKAPIGPRGGLVWLLAGPRNARATRRPPRSRWYSGRAPGRSGTFSPSARARSK